MTFPTLKENQFAVVMADGYTGIVLNVDNTIYENNTAANIYFVFEDIESAKEFIKNYGSLHEKNEFIIYNHKQEMVGFTKSRIWK